MIPPLGKRISALLILLLLIAGPALAGDFDRSRIDRLLVNGGLLLERNGTVIASRNLEQPLTPASIWKIATALNALHTIGPDFRFVTNLFLGRDHTLYVQGNGDPLLVSEEIDRIMAALAAKGVQRINDIVLDADRFQLSGDADGAGNSSNPYDAANGALAVNFNTVNVLVNKDHRICSAEPQTPTLPLMAELANGLPVGEHRINIGSDRNLILRHAGELFRAMQVRHHIRGEGQIRQGRTPQGLEPVLQHRSGKNLRQLIAGMLRYSNNFTANQLFLTCGARRFGYPATWEKGREAMVAYLAGQLHLGPEAVTVEEGSGLSRKNRITVHAMQTVLSHFKPYSALLPLQKGKRIKSGTLTGVYSYAGYLPQGKNLDSFVLILNQPANNRDRLLKILTTLHHR